jgi:hypothetical protein
MNCGVQHSMAAIKSEQEYYILSLNGTHGIDHLLWWRRENRGYTTYLDQAGKYSQKDVSEHSDYYNNNESTVAVPCEIVDGSTHTVVNIDDLHKLFNGMQYYQTEDGLIHKDKYKEYVSHKKHQYDETFDDNEAQEG